MIRIEFEAECRRDGYEVGEGEIQAHVRRQPHSHDFDAPVRRGRRPHPRPRRGSRHVRAGRGVRRSAGTVHAEHTKRTACASCTGAAGRPHPPRDRVAPPSLRPRRPAGRAPRPDADSTLVRVQNGGRRPVPRGTRAPCGERSPLRRRSAPIEPARQRLGSRWDPDRHLQTILTVRHERRPPSVVTGARPMAAASAAAARASRALTGRRRKSWMPWIPPRAVLDTLSADGAG
jgi:hypothetical protein